MINAKISAFSVPKQGNKEDENEDAFKYWIKPKHGHDFLELFCAIADGATRASYTRLWANLLVQNFANAKREPSSRLFSQILSQSRSEWEKQTTMTQPLPWYAIDNYKKGAFASFLAISLKTNLQRSYAYLKALSIGDCELLVYRKSQLILAFPICDSSRFGSNPSAISTVINNNKNLETMKKSLKVFPGDQILLCTDALGQYLLSKAESGDSLEDSLDSHLLKNPVSSTVFERWVNTLRLEGRLKNDDSTLVLITL